LLPFPVRLGLGRQRDIGDIVSVEP
jgi:hypothetical protein